jgi:twitching motility protein PilT
MSLVPSLLQAIVKADGEAMVMHAGDKPYVVSPTGQLELASRGLTLEAVNGIVGQLLPPEIYGALDEFGAIQHELRAFAEFPGEHFTVVAARGGDDVWVEIRRRRVSEDDRLPEELFPQPPSIVAAAPPVVSRPAAVAATPLPPVATTPALVVQASGLRHDIPSDATAAPVAAHAAIAAREAAPQDDLILPDETQLFGRPVTAFTESELREEDECLVDLEADVEVEIDVTTSPAAAAAWHEAPIVAPETVAMPAIAQPPLSETLPPALELVEPEIEIPAPPIAGVAEPEPAVAKAPSIPLPLPEVAHVVEPAMPRSPVAVVPVLELESAVTSAPVVPQTPALEMPWPDIEVAELEVSEVTEDDAPESAVAEFPLAQKTPVLDVPWSDIEMADLDVAAIENAERAIEEVLEPVPLPEAAEIAAPEPIVAAAPWIPEPLPVAEVEHVVAHEPLVAAWIGESDAVAEAAEIVAHEPLVTDAPWIPEPLPPAEVAEVLEDEPIVADTPWMLEVPVVPVDAAPLASIAEPEDSAAPLLPHAAVVLPISRSPIRFDPPPPPASDVALPGLDRLLRLASARGASTLYLSSESRPSVRVDGELQMLDAEPVHTSRDVESLLLTLMPERNHEALRTGALTEWFCDIEGVGRVRCMSFRDHRGPGGVFRLMPTRSASVEQLGLPRHVQSLASEPAGLVLVAGPRSSGKRTLMAAFVDLMNRTRRDHVITIEREINIVHDGGQSFISQREVRGSDDDLLAAARGALREDPDVLMIEDLRTRALMNVALEAAASGHLIVGGFTAHTAGGAIDRIIDLYAPEQRRHVQLALADSLRGVVVQVLLRKTGGGRVPAREVLLNTPAVSSAIAEGTTSQLPMAIEGGRRHGMMPLNDSLVGLVQSGTVDAREAYRQSPDRPGFLAALARQGLDTSFIERLA